MINCPRCGDTMPRHPALSRADNRTAVCSDCGVEEAIEAMKRKVTPRSAWPVHRARFNRGER